MFLEGCVLDAFCKLPNGKLVVAPVWPGWCVFPDFTNPAVRHWWSRQYRFLLDTGVAGFWHDMNEPAAFIVRGDRSLPPRATQHHMEGRGGNHLEAHNSYGLLQTQAAYESLCQSRPQQRPYVSIQVQVHGMALEQAWVDGRQIAIDKNLVIVSKLFSFLHLKEASVPTR